MTDETPQAEGEPSPATPDESPSAETQPVTHDAAQNTDDEDDVTPAAADAPTQATPVADPTATPTTPVAAPTATPAAPPVASAAAERPAGIFVPKWVGLVAAAIVAALVFGGIGYAIGDSQDSGTSQSASSFPGTANGNGTNGPFGNGGPFGQGRLPNGNGTTNGNGNSSGNSSGNSNGNSGNSGNSGNGNSTTPSTIPSNAGFLGVGVETANNGVQITDVASGSPAASAGLQTGDVITAIDGTNVTTASALSSAIQAKSSGDQITVAYTRGGNSNTVKVTLTSRAQAQSN